MGELVVNHASLGKCTKNKEICGFGSSYDNGFSLMIKCLRCGNVQEYKIDTYKIKGLVCNKCRYMEYLIQDVESYKDKIILNFNIISKTEYIKRNKKIKESKTINNDEDQ